MTMKPALLYLEVKSRLNHLGKYEEKEVAHHPRAEPISGLRNENKNPPALLTKLRISDEVLYVFVRLRANI